MIKRLIIPVIGFCFILAFIAPHSVFAQSPTCTDPFTGGQVPCPPAPGDNPPEPGNHNKKPTQIPPTKTPSPTETFTPTSTLTPTLTPTALPSLTPIKKQIVSIPSVVPHFTIIPNANGLGEQASGLPFESGWLFGLLLPAVLVLMGWFYISQKRKGGKSVFGMTAPGSPDAPGSDVMGAQPHMQPGNTIGIGNPDFMPSGPPDAPGSDVMGAQPHMQPGNTTGIGNPDLQPPGPSNMPGSG